MFFRLTILMSLRHTARLSIIQTIQMYVRQTIQLSVKQAIQQNVTPTKQMSVKAVIYHLFALALLLFVRPGLYLKKTYIKYFTAILAICCHFK